MIVTNQLTTLEDFQAVKKGDFLAVEWHLDSRIGNKRTRFAVYQVFDTHHDRRGEIILQRQNNVYFSYNLLLGIVEGHSNAKSVSIIKQEVS